MSGEGQQCYSVEPQFDFFRIIAWAEDDDVQMEGREGEPAETDWIVRGRARRVVGNERPKARSDDADVNCAHGITGRNSPEAVSYFTKACKIFLILEIPVRIKASNKFSLTLGNWGEISPFSGHGHFPSPVKQNPIRVAAQSPPLFRRGC